MRDRRVRVAFVGLALAFPLLMVSAGPRTSPTATARQSWLPIVAVEAVVVGGLMTAARERRRLLAERAAGALSPPRPSPGAPHARATRLVRRRHALKKA